MQLIDEWNLLIDKVSIVSNFSIGFYGVMDIFIPTNPCSALSCFF